MSSEGYLHSALFEHRFWLQILGDHARFIFNALSPGEHQEVQEAQYFINIFDQLLGKARRDLTMGEVSVLNREASEQAQRIRNFKLSLLRQHLAERIFLQLPPTFLNHMVNEVEEYLRILQFLLVNKEPHNLPAISLHLLWVSDAAGHGFALVSGLDQVENELIERSKSFAQVFQNDYLKAVEMAGYTRTGLGQFPALARFNFQVQDKIIVFREFLKELEEMIIKKQLLGTIGPLMPDHMSREECYYLTKLAAVTEVNKPACDPTKPRLE